MKQSKIIVRNMPDIVIICIVLHTLYTMKGRLYTMKKLKMNGL